jgi:hypothetical protein
MHTEGKVRLFNKRKTIAIMDRDGKELVAWMGFESGSRPHRETVANARRLVTCWNEHDGLVKERDELVRALRKALCVGKLKERIDARCDAEAILAKYPETRTL